MPKSKACQRYVCRCRWWSMPADRSYWLIQNSTNSSGKDRKMLTNLKAAFRYFNSVVPFRLGPALITTVVLITLLLLPVPEGLKPKAWGLVAIFLTTIVAIILKVMP